MQNANPSEIDWSSNKDPKRNNDEKCIEKIQAIAPCGATNTFRSLSFPASEWHFERRISREFRQGNFLGIEQKPEVHAKMLENAKLLNTNDYTYRTTPRPASLFESITGKGLGIEEDEQFDLVYADFMGTWCQAKKESIRQIFQRNLIADGGMLMITIMLIRGTQFTKRDMAWNLQNGPGYDVIDDERTEINQNTFMRLDRSCVGRLKTIGVANTIGNLAKTHNQSVQAVRVGVYDSICGQRNIPEISMLFQINYR